MPKWIHDRAMSLKKDMEKTYGPEKAEQVAFAVATQQAHRLGKSPKKFKSKVTGKMERFGTLKGRKEAKMKFDKPKKEYQKTASDVMYTSMLEELEKIAEDELKEDAEDAEDRATHVRNLARGGVLAGVGASTLASPGVRGSLLGYQRVYHGTSPETAEKIKREGFDPAYGGQEGGSAHISQNPDYIERSKGKVHVTTSPEIAKQYAMIQHSPYYSILGDSNPERTKKGIVSADLPMSLYDKFKVDPDMASPDVPDFANKLIAATSEEAIAPEFIHGTGAKNYLKRLSTVARELPSYIKAHPGRFGLGVLGTSISTGLTAKGLSDMASAVRGIRAAKDETDE